MKPSPERSHEPLFWALFGAGGMLSALVGPMLVLITGVLVPLGLLLPADTFSAERALAFARHPLGKVALLGVISLFMFHGCHRMLHSLHDLGVRTGLAARVGFYGAATGASVLAVALLLRIGF